MSIFEYDKEKEEKKLRKAEYEHGLEEGLQEGLQKGREEGIETIITLLERMTAGGDGDKTAELKNPKVLSEMKKKYGIE